MKINKEKCPYDIAPEEINMHESVLSQPAVIYHSHKRPRCSVCGKPVVKRAGTCYVCDNCGSVSGGCE